MRKEFCVGKKAKASDSFCVTPTRPDSPPASGSAADGSAFHWLPTGAVALEAMLEAIGRARRSVLLETYIFTAETLGLRFLGALVAARRRGARVRVLVDALGSITLPTQFWTPLLRAGGEFRWFNAFHARQHYGCRNHRKLLVVDGQTAYIGGFNIADVYHGDGVHEGWRDLGLELHGPVVPALAASFTELFACADSRLPTYSPLRNMPETEVCGENWTLLLTDPGRGHRALKRALIRDLSRARRVQITCAYFLPTWRLRRALKRAARRGDVQLILAGKSDIATAQLASHSLYAKLMRAGVKIYEYQPQILHAKLFVIDEVVYAGSANLDARSLKLNYELALRIADPEVAAQGSAFFEADLALSREIDPAQWRASRGWWRRLLEKAAYFLLARVDPYVTNLQWRHRAARALEKLPRRAGG